MTGRWCWVYTAGDRHLSVINMSCSHHICTHAQTRQSDVVFDSPNLNQNSKLSVGFSFDSIEDLQHCNNRFMAILMLLTVLTWALLIVDWTGCDRNLVFSTKSAGFVQPLRVSARRIATTALPLGPTLPRFFPHYRHSDCHYAQIISCNAICMARSRDETARGVATNFWVGLTNRRQCGQPTPRIP